MLDVCLLGTSGMMPLPGRALTALMTRFNGSSLLVDCGEGTQVSIREKGWSMHDIDTICITHIHGDHVSGLPGLLLSMGNTERTAPLQVIGPRGVRRVLESLLVIAPGLPFEIRCQELTEKVLHIELNGSELTAFRVSHTVPCYGYCQVIHRAGRFDVEKAKTNQVPMAVWSRLQKTDTVILDGREYTSDMVVWGTRDVWKGKRKQTYDFYRGGGTGKTGRGVRTLADAFQPIFSKTGFLYERSEKDLSLCKAGQRPQDKDIEL